MDMPSSKSISDFHRYFAIQCNNEFWKLSEGELNEEEKQRLLPIAFASLFHWQAVGTDKNIHLAYMAVARAYCVIESLESIQYANRAFEYFDGQGENWIQAFTTAIKSHALHIAGETIQSIELYKRATLFQSKLSDGDRKVFDATFIRLPVLG